MYASENAFGGCQEHRDNYAYGRICLFLALDWSDFIQLSFMPIEDDQMLQSVRNGIQSFEIIKQILKCLKTGYKDSDVQHELFFCVISCVKLNTNIPLVLFYVLS